MTIEYNRHLGLLELESEDLSYKVIKGREDIMRTLEALETLGLTLESYGHHTSKELKEDFGISLEIEEGL